MYEIPTTIWIDDNEIEIREKGDYRMVIDCFLALSDIDLTQTERLISSLIIFYNDLNSVEDVFNLSEIDQRVQEMFKFFTCGEESTEDKSSYKLIDWEKDSQLICSAINKVAGVEIRSVPYIHWWTFMGYYTAIGESPLSTIIAIRDKIIHNEKLEKYEQKLRRSCPQYFNWNFKNVEEQELDNLVSKLWNSED